MHYPPEITWELFAQIREVLSESELLTEILKIINIDTLETIVKAIIKDYDLNMPEFNYSSTSSN